MRVTRSLGLLIVIAGAKDIAAEVTARRTMS
jgi:hypothetical protein